MDLNLGNHHKLVYYALTSNFSDPASHSTNIFLLSLVGDGIEASGMGHSWELLRLPGSLPWI